MSISIEEQINFLKFQHEDTASPPLNSHLYDILKDPESKNYMEQIIDTILYIRNIHTGRGLRLLTYSLLYTLQQFYPGNAVFIIYMMVDKSIGSWRDVRSYCEFVAEHSEKGRKDPIIKPIIGLYNNQLIKDREIWKQTIDSWDPDTTPRPHARNYISCAVRWIPRPRKRRGWLFHMLVVMWVYKDPEYKTIVNSTDDSAYAEHTCKMMYRKMISDLNKELDRSENDS
jgi:hypothetical protein